MSKLTVSEINTPSNNDPLFFRTGNTSAGFLKLESANSDIIIEGNFRNFKYDSAWHTANAAFDQANSVAISANSWANTLYISALQNANNDANASNSYADTLYISALQNANNDANSSNSYADTLYISALQNANNDANSSNSYAVTIGAAANTWANTKLANSTGTFSGSLTITGSIIATSATLGTHHSVDVNGFIARCGGGNYNVRMYPGGGTDTAASILQFTNAAQNAQWGSLYQSNTSMGLGTDLSVPLYFRTGGTNRVYVDSTGHVLPAASNTYDLGASTARWRNIFTGDLHLANDHGDWTIVEGEDELFLYNNKKDKVYKFNLTEVDKSEAPPKKG